MKGQYSDLPQDFQHGMGASFIGDVGAPVLPKLALVSKKEG